MTADAPSLRSPADPSDGATVSLRAEAPPAEHGAVRTDARSRRHKLVAAAAFAAPVVAAAVAGARYGPADKATMRWYRRLRKAPFNPPNGVFSPVWTALYASIAASGYRVWAAPDHRLRRPAMALWATQLAANAAWSPIFFGRRNPTAALAVLAAQLGVGTAYAATAARVDRAAGGLMVPTLAWTGFAGVLNEEVVRRNPDDRTPS